jgi:hypothetical protein
MIWKGRLESEDEALNRCSMTGIEGTISQVDMHVNVVVDVL